MFSDDNINLYHFTGINCEFVPEEFQKIHVNRLNIQVNPFSNKILRGKNLSTINESEFVYIDPNINKKNLKERTFKYNTIIKLNKKKVLKYFESENYTEFFNLFKLYLISLFNGLNKEQIKKLYKNRQITDSVYLFAIKIFDIIDNNEKKYSYIKVTNPDNVFETTENFYKIKEVKNYTIKEDAMLIIIKFHSLLKVIDENVYKEEIEELNNIYEKIK